MHLGAQGDEIEDCLPGVLGGIHDACDKAVGFECSLNRIHALRRGWLGKGRRNRRLPDVYGGADIFCGKTPAKQLRRYQPRRFVTDGDRQVAGHCLDRR